jgi:hypothetical protein
LFTFTGAENRPQNWRLWSRQHEDASMKANAFAAIAVALGLGIAPACAQNTNATGKAQANTAPAKANQGNPSGASQTAAANGSAAGGSTTAPQTTTQANASEAESSAPPSGKNVEIGTATINPKGIPPSQRNPLLADNGEVRISKLIGSTIYNQDDQKVGSVNEVLAGQNGQLQVVVSTNNKKTLVPWDRLVFGDAKLNSDNKVLMPNATQAQLDKMQAFNFQNTNSNGNQKTK